MTRSIRASRTLNGLKHHASKIQKATGLPRSKGLDIAAKLAGFAHFAHANRELPQTLPCTRFAAHWRTTEGQYGIEVFSYPFLLPVAQLYPKRYAGPRLGHFSPTVSGELLANGVASDQMMARGWICEALRALLFIETTGLQPRLGVSRAYPLKQKRFMGRSYREAVTIPGEDHISTWYDPKSGGYVIADEPYIGNELHPCADDRASWCVEYGYHQVQVEWGGMYHPEIGSRLFLFTREGSGIDLLALKSKLDLLPDDFSDENWPG